jgi:hypothetical protein
MQLSSVVGTVRFFRGSNKVDCRESSDDSSRGSSKEDSRESSDVSSRGLSKEDRPTLPSGKAPHDIKPVIV